VATTKPYKLLIKYKFMQETILVTGCSGFIGSHVSEHALTEGYHVIGMDVKDCKNPEVEFITGSITDRQAVENAVSRAD
jgi:Nucleoside-diphosphate-sugar epimerases